MGLNDIKTPRCYSIWMCDDIQSFFDKWHNKCEIKVVDLHDKVCDIIFNGNKNLNVVEMLSFIGKKETAVRLVDHLIYSNLNDVRVDNTILFAVKELVSQLHDESIGGVIKEIKNEKT